MPLGVSLDLLQRQLAGHAQPQHTGASTGSQLPSARASVLWSTRAEQALLPNREVEVQAPRTKDWRIANVQQHNTDGTYRVRVASDGTTVDIPRTAIKEPSTRPARTFAFAGAQSYLRKALLGDAMSHSRGTGAFFAHGHEAAIREKMRGQEGIVKRLSARVAQLVRQLYTTGPSTGPGPGTAKAFLAEKERLDNIIKPLVAKHGRALFNPVRKQLEAVVEQFLLSQGKARKRPREPSPVQQVGSSGGGFEAYDPGEYQQTHKSRLS